jgi:hypothetical protein
MKFKQPWLLKYSGQSLTVHAAEVDTSSHCLTHLEILQEQVAESGGCWRIRIFLTENYNGIGGELSLEELTDILKVNPKDYLFGEYEVYQELYNKYQELAANCTLAI